MSVKIKEGWVEDYEKELDAIHLDKEMISMLDRNRESKLQIVERKGVRYIRCLPDHDALLRCVVVSLVRHILLDEPAKLRALKETLYASSMFRMTKHHGLVLEQIHSLIHSELKSL